MTPQHAVESHARNAEFLRGQRDVLLRPGERLHESGALRVGSWQRPDRRRDRSLGWLAEAGQIVERDNRRIADHHRASNRRHEFPHIAGPVVPAQCVHGFGSETRDLATEMRRRLTERMLRQQRDVIRPLAQRRHHQRQDVEPIVQVLAETPFADRLAQAHVGGGNDTDVDR